MSLNKTAVYKNQINSYFILIVKKFHYALTNNANSLRIVK